jgi:hypothetical protein
MADIDVVPKHRSGLSWVWMLVIAAIIVLALWWAFGGTRGTANNPTGRLNTPAPALSSSSPAHGMAA